MINHFQAHGHILIYGDLNARTGEGPDTINTLGDKHLPGDGTGALTPSTHWEINTYQETGPSPPQSVLPDITKTKLQTNMEYNYYSCAAPRDCTLSMVDPAETPMEDTPTAHISAVVL